MNKFLDFYGITMVFFIKKSCQSYFQKYKPPTSNYFTIPKVKILKLTDNIPSKFKECYCAFC